MAQLLCIIKILFIYISSFLHLLIILNPNKFCSKFSVNRVIQIFHKYLCRSGLNRSSVSPGNKTSLQISSRTFVAEVGGNMNRRVKRPSARSRLRRLQEEFSIVAGAMQRIERIGQSYADASGSNR